MAKQIIWFDRVPDFLKIGCIRINASHNTKLDRGNIVTYQGEKVNGFVSVSLYYKSFWS